MADGCKCSRLLLRRKIFIFVCGIMTWPGSSRNWTGRAVTWVQTRKRFAAEKIEYFTTPIGRRFGESERAEKLISTLRFYQDWEIVLVGHSNGCDVILDALAEMPGLRVEALHLISGACEADFQKNGINQRLANGTLERVFCYTAKKDWALVFTRLFTVRRVLGFGTLGRKGPLNPRPEVITRVEADFGHSDWFEDSCFDETMELVTAE